jgi:hypothetical protein
MLGMNAHIYLDLGIAAAQTAPGDALPGLEMDFIAINHLLASMVNAVQDSLAAVSPWLGWLDVVGGGHDETIANFNMREARDSAWNLALKLAAQTETERAETIQRRDDAVADFASLITRPGLTLGAVIFLIWLRERREAAHIIEVMGGKS